MSPNWLDYCTIKWYYSPHHYERTMNIRKNNIIGGVIVILTITLGFGAYVIYKDSNSANSKSDSALENITTGSSGEKIDFNPTPIPKLLQQIIAKDITNKELKIQLQLILNDISKDFINEQVDAIIEEIKNSASPEMQLNEYIARFIQISQDGIIRNDYAPITATFCTEVNANNIPANASFYFPTSSKRIYACFPIPKELKESKKIVARWVNASNGQILYLDSKPPNLLKSINCVAFAPNDSWEKGLYQVELYKIGTLEKIAQGAFEVK